MPLFAAIVTIGVLRVIATYPVFCQTNDEGYKTARGLEWLTRGTYTYVDHPPLGTIPLAIGPAIAGARYTPMGSKKADGNAIFYNGNYFVMLSSARAATLVFFLIASAFVWTWARRHFGTAAAVLCLVIFSTTPIVLAHTGLATNDIAAAATIAWLVDRFMKWVDRPTWENGTLLGLLFAVATLVKFSAPALFAVAAIGLVLARSVFGGKVSGRQDTGGYLASSAIAFAIFVMVVWSVYLFSWGTLREIQAGPAGQAVARGEVFGADFGKLADAPLPAPEFVGGLLSQAAHNRQGHAPYFFGPNRTGHGDWRFFPVLMGIKNPLCFLALLLIGIGTLLAKAWAGADWQVAAPVVIPICFLELVMFANINLGLHHYLPAFPFLAIVAGYGLFSLLRTRRVVPVSVGMLLLFGHIMPGVFAHPDYLPYFNPLAGEHPERIVVSGDLDWGQDLPRLAEECRKRNIDHLHLAYFGTALPAKHGLPMLASIPPEVEASGWIAISLAHLMRQPQYSWLQKHSPVTIVGKSIALYRLTESARSDAHDSGIN